MKIAYIRTSSVQQNLDVQRETVTKFGVDKIFEEQVSGASTDNREQLKQALDFVRDGDELVVTRIDRLARSVRDLQNIVHELEQKNVKQPPYNYLPQIKNSGMENLFPKKS